MIDMFPQIEATLTRPTNTYSAGRAVAGASTTADITIVVPQPATQRDLQMVAEGEQSFDHRKTYTATEIKNRDVITAQGKSYKVAAVGEWYDPDTGVAYYKAVMREVTHAN